MVDLTIASDNLRYQYNYAMISSICPENIRIFIAIGFSVLLFVSEPLVNIPAESHIWSQLCFIRRSLSIIACSG